jgi:tetratricopeptide (TPR) repeat protein
MTPIRCAGMGVLALSLVLSFSSATVAQTTDDGAEANARRLYGAGSAAYDEHRYEDALAYFEEAYAITPRPLLLYNIGLAAEHAGNRARAIEALEQYLAAQPDAENRVEVESRLSVLRRGESTTEAAPTPPSVAPPPPVASSGPGPEGWIVMGVSLALVVGGAVLVGVGANDYATVTGLPDGGAWASVHDAADRAPILVGVGIACAAVGVVGTIVGVVMATSGSGEATVTARLGLDGVRIEGTF